MDERIQARVVTGLRRTGAEFEAIEPGKTEEFVGHVTEAYAALLAARRRLPEDAVAAHGGKARPDRYSIAWHLLWGAVNSMTAAWALLERGYPTEPLAVARHAMEQVACAIVLFDNPDLVPRFSAGRLGSAFSTLCITPVSRVVRDFGQTYAMLTEFGARVAPEVVSLPFAPTTGAEVPPALAVAGDLRNEGPERRHRAQISDLFCGLVRDILTPAGENVFFRTRRTAVLEE
jgi:hypothetical protein